jgi:L-fucose mutarotase/ribose pyranase (RbsD/FucU family)
MRNVEKQAQALKLALEAATDIQANPGWDYAHIVACIQGAILDMPLVPTDITTGLVQHMPKVNEGYDMVVTDGEFPSVTLTVPGHSYTYAVRGDVEAIKKLQRAIAITNPNDLKKFIVAATSYGVTVTVEDMTLPHVRRERTATIAYVKGETGELTALDFIRHTFKNSPIEAFPQ